MLPTELFSTKNEFYNNDVRRIDKAGHPAIPKWKSPISPLIFRSMLCPEIGRPHEGNNGLKRFEGGSGYVYWITGRPSGCGTCGWERSWSMPDGFDRFR